MIHSANLPKPLDRCHHLHTNIALRLPLDPQEHTRFYCDNCEHPILGIGRTSTQTTLASIETNAAGQRSWRTDPEPASDQDYQPSPPLAQSPPLRVDTSGHSGQLSTIAEGVSPAPQSSAVHTPAVSGDLRSERSISQEWTPTQRISRDEEHRAREHKKPEIYGPVPIDRLLKPSGGFWKRQSQRSLRETIRRHLQKPRSFHISKLGLHVHVSHTTPSASGRAPLPATNPQPTNTCESSKDAPAVSIASAQARATRTSGLSTPVRSNPGSVHSAEASQPSASAHPDPLIGRTWTLPEKHERIRALRREATLKRQAELISRCECQSECQCRSGSVRSNAASVGPAPSERSIQVPDHALHRVLGEWDGSSTSGGSSSGTNGGTFLVGIGGHLASGAVADGWSNQGGEQQQMVSDRISQASTVNGSSVSLSSRRAGSLRRSSTTPASMPRRSVEEYRPDLLEVTRSQHILVPGHEPSAEGSAPRAGSENVASAQASCELHGLPT